MEYLDQVRFYNLLYVRLKLRRQPTPNQLFCELIRNPSNQESRGKQFQRQAYEPRNNQGVS